MGLLDFLFGKDPDIFDEKGNVRHKLPEQKWKAWNDRFRSKDYDWRQHKGRSGESLGPQAQIGAKRSEK